MEDKLVLHRLSGVEETRSVISARLPDSMVEDLDNVAFEVGRSRNEIIRLCVQYSLDHLELDLSKRK